MKGWGSSVSNYCIEGVYEALNLLGAPVGISSDSSDGDVAPGDLSCVSNVALCFGR